MEYQLTRVISEIKVKWRIQCVKADAKEIHCSRISWKI